MPFHRRSLATLLPALCLAVFVLFVNAHWFRMPMVEASDYAANSLQVYGAKHFRELLGNYSRWGFHHPGPVFFYLFAVGETVFMDLLHLAPAPMNAHEITLILINTALLFGAIEICASHFCNPLFRPLGWLAAVFVIANLNHGGEEQALVSLWMPNVAFFPFLFLVVACASTLAGRISHLPFVTLGAGMMLHLHAAQVAFVAALCLPVGAVVACQIVRTGSFRAHASTLAVSGALAALFVLPIALEALIHKPNNLYYIRAYLRKYPNPHQGWDVAAKYLLCFLTLAPDAERLTPGPAIRIVQRALQTPQVVVFWIVLSASAGTAAWLRVRGGRLRFAALLVALCGLVTCVFLYWADRITGEMFTFNGYFFFSIHLVVLFAMAGILSERLSGSRFMSVQLTRGIWLAPMVLTLCCAAAFHNPFTGYPEIGPLSDSLPAAAHYQLVFGRDDWETAAGVANQITRRGQTFCVTDDWAFIFGQEHICSGTGSVRPIVITRGGWHDLGQ